MLTELKNREVRAEIELSGREVMVCIQMWTSTPINSEGRMGYSSTVNLCQSLSVWSLQDMCVLTCNVLIRDKKKETSLG